MKVPGLALLILILAASCSKSEDPAATPTEETVAASEAAENLPFAETVPLVNLYEIRAGQLALQKSESDAYRSFAQTMVDQHGEISAVYAALARQQELAVPEELSGRFDALYQELENAPAGGEFDALYRAQMLETHKTAVALFRNEAERGEDPRLKEFAERFLDTVEMHLEMAERLPPAS